MSSSKLLSASNPGEGEAEPPLSQFWPSVGADLSEYLGALIRFAGASRLMAALALMTGSALVEGAGLLMLAPLLQSLDAERRAVLPLAFLGNPVLPLTAWLAALVALVLLRALLERWRDLRVAAIQLGYVEDLRNRLHQAIARAEWRFLSTTVVADFMRALVSDLDRIDFGSYWLMQLLVSILLAAAGIAVAASLSPVMTLTTLVIAACLWWLLRGRLSRAHRLGARLGNSNRAFLATTSDFLNSLKLAKSTGAESGLLSDFTARTRQLSELNADFVRSRTATRVVITVGSAGLVALLLLIAVNALNLPTAELLVILLIFARLLPLVGNLHEQTQTVLHMLPAHANAQRWLRVCAAAAEPAPDEPQAEFRFTRELRLEGVSYRHQTDGPVALHDVDLVIAARRTTALVGPSGAGKTTLADLILGLTAPDSGTLSVDGRPLAGCDRQAMRRTAAYVPQDAFLFPGTIRSNLLWANPGMAEDRLWQALALAAADDFVRALPQGLDSPVGERGIRLSGGERQRIALARALLRDPQLLVLDEATSHLDSESERHIQRALEQLHGKVTLLLIAHRLSTVRHADNIVVIERGRIVETGDWDALVQGGGRFREIFDASLAP